MIFLSVSLGYLHIIQLTGTQEGPGDRTNVRPDDESLQYRPAPGDESPLKGRHTDGNRDKYSTVESSNRDRADCLAFTCSCDGAKVTLHNTRSSEREGNNGYYCNGGKEPPYGEYLSDVLELEECASHSYKEEKGA